MTYDTDEDEAEYMADDDTCTEDYEPGICPACSGSGEGQYEATTCSACKGKGEI